VELRKTAFTEACADFGWSEKELRNKMQAGSLPWALWFSLLTRFFRAVWKGYREVEDAAGSPLLFSLALASITSANIAFGSTTWPCQDCPVLGQGSRLPLTHCIPSCASYCVLSASRATEDTTVTPTTRLSRNEAVIRPHLLQPTTNRILVSLLSTFVEAYK
jgi:hypothetical protein